MYLRSAGLSCFSLKAHGFAARIRLNQNRLARENLRIENLHRQRILNQPLNSPLQRPRPINWIVAFAQQQLSRRFRKLESDLALDQQADEARKLKVDDLLDFLLREWMEENDIVHA